MAGRRKWSVAALVSFAALTVLAFAGARAGGPGRGSAAAAIAPAAERGGRADVAPPDPVQRGRWIVVSHDCGGCHGGDGNPSAPGWLAGEMRPEQQFLIGPCYLKPGAQPCFHTHPRNLTPDNETGLGRFTERQIFNALRFGLRPEETPDVTITSMTPGQGNFPLHPRYLAVPMPWPTWRHMPDADLWAIAAYLKRGLKPVHNKVPESEGPPDFWASAYTVDKIGPYPLPPFPTANEVGAAVKAASGGR